MPDSVTKDPVSEIQYPSSILEDVAKLVHRVQTFTGAAGAAIALREGDDMVCRASRGSNAPDVGMILSLDGTFAGLAVTGMKAVRCDDTENDPRVDPEVSRALRIKSMAVVPVLSGMRVSGVIATFSSAGNAFSNTHMAVLKTMADGLGANIQRWLESQGISTNAAYSQTTFSSPKPQAPPPAKVEVPRPAPPAAPRFEAPKPAPVVAPPAPVIETPAPAVAASAAAAAPALEKAIEPKAQPKKAEPKLQGKWKPVSAPKQEEEAPVAEAKPQPKAEPIMEAPAFSYEASSGSEGSKTPMILGIVAAVVIAAAAGGYFLFGRSSSKPALSAAPAVTTPKAASLPSATPATPALATTADTKPATVGTTKPDAPKPGVDMPKPATPVADVTRSVAPPIVIAPKPSEAKQTADLAPPSISLAGSEGPALDVPMTTSAPKLSAPASANAVIVPSRLLQRVNPAYPIAAKQYRVEGAVTLSATIGPDGHVREAKVISGPPLLRDAATNAVKQWKYVPSTVNGRAVESTVQIVLQFKMPK
jgi:TonB family protein